MTFFKCLQRAHSFMLRVWFHLFYKEKTHELLLQAPICHGSFATQKYHCKWNKMLFVIWLVIPMLQSILLWFWKFWHEIVIGSSVQSASSRLQNGWGAFLTQNRQLWKFKSKGKRGSLTIMLLHPGEFVHYLLSVYLSCSVPLACLSSL